MNTSTLSRIENLKQTSIVFEGFKSMASAMNKAHAHFKETVGYSGPIQAKPQFSENGKTVYHITPKPQLPHYGRDYELHFIF